MGESGKATPEKLNALEQYRKDLEDKLAELERGARSPAGMIASRGDLSDTAEDEAEQQGFAESIRQEILLLNSEAESLSLATLLPPPSLSIVVFEGKPSSAAARP